MGYSFDHFFFLKHNYTILSLLSLPFAPFIYVFLHYFDIFFKITCENHSKYKMLLSMRGGKNWKQFYHFLVCTRRLLSQFIFTFFIFIILFLIFFLIFFLNIFVLFVFIILFIINLFLHLVIYLCVLIFFNFKSTCLVSILLSHLESCYIYSLFY